VDKYEAAEQAEDNAISRAHMLLGGISPRQRERLVYLLALRDLLQPYTPGTRPRPGR
jgi:hypothetical protein